MPEEWSYEPESVVHRLAILHNNIGWMRGRIALLEQEEVGGTRRNRSQMPGRSGLRNPDQLRLGTASVSCHSRTPP